MSCLSLGPVLLVSGGIMYGVCKNAISQGTCSGNGDIATAGIAMMFVGSVVFCVACCCVAMAGVIKSDSKV